MRKLTLDQQIEYETALEGIQQRSIRRLISFGMQCHNKTAPYAALTKPLHNVSAVYAIVHRASGGVYIGQSANMQNVINKWMRLLRDPAGYGTEQLPLYVEYVKRFYHSGRGGFAWLISHWGGQPSPVTGKPTSTLRVANEMIRNMWADPHKYMPLNNSTSKKIDGDKFWADCTRADGKELALLKVERARRALAKRVAYRPLPVIDPSLPDNQPEVATPLIDPRGSLPRGKLLKDF